MNTCFEEKPYSDDLEICQERMTFCRAIPFSLASLTRVALDAAPPASATRGQTNTGFTRVLSADGQRKSLSTRAHRRNRRSRIAQPVAAVFPIPVQKSANFPDRSP